MRAAKKNALGAGCTRPEGSDTNPTASSEHEETSSMSISEPTTTVQTSAALSSWLTRTAESVTTLSSTALDPVSATFPEPAWSRGHGPDGDEPATVRVRPSERISVSESAAVPLLRAAGREVGGRVSFSSADVRVAQRHTDREPHVQLRRNVYSQREDAPIAGEWLDLLSLRTCEARQLGETLVAAADLAENREPTAPPAPADPADVRARAQDALQRVIEAQELETVEAEAMTEGFDAAAPDAQLRWTHATQARIAATQAVLVLIDEALASAAAPTTTDLEEVRAGIDDALVRAMDAAEVEGGVRVAVDLTGSDPAGADSVDVARATARTRAAGDTVMTLVTAALAGGAA